MSSSRRRAHRVAAAWDETHEPSLRRSRSPNGRQGALRRLAIRVFVRAVRRAPRRRPQAGSRGELETPGPRLAETFGVGNRCGNPRPFPWPRTIEADGLLWALAAEPTRVFTKEELLRDVWGFRSMAT
jgi:hypothetical protein